MSKSRAQTALQPAQAIEFTAFSPDLEISAVWQDWMVADAVPANQSPISLKLAAAENSLGSANLSGKSPDFGLLAES
jgi:hypothetical protein